VLTTWIRGGRKSLIEDGGGRELHLVRFPSQGAFEAYHADPRRQSAAHLLEASAAVTELIRV
jgi:hypothetical protein